MERFSYELSLGRIEDFQKEAKRERLVKEALDTNPGSWSSWFKRLFSSSPRPTRSMAESRTDSPLAAQVK